ncbi:MAG: ComEC/Rec2 family competence protein [Bacteroidota bacterium]
MKILQFPLTRITIWFVLGILISYYANFEITFIFLFLLISFIGLGTTYFLARNDYRQKIYFGIATYFLSFLIGITTQTVHTDFFQKNNYSHLVKNYESEHILEIVLREKLKSSFLNDRYIAIVKKIDSKESTGRILINFHKKEVNQKLQIGTNLKIKGFVFKHRAPSNPNQFDYGNYLRNKSILAQMYADVIKINLIIDRDIWYYSDLLRSRIVKNLQKRDFAKEELAVIVALILGQQQDISPEILNDYQFAGAIHILSVSGLHVGFILLFINLLLQPLPKNRFGNLLKLLIVVLSLWCFAILAGFSPSVIRSVTMFSFVAVGMYLKRSTNIFHTLLVSALLILLFQPSFLFDVGFQLSYIALFFILWLQPLLNVLWNPKNRIAKYFWDILTVSFAAQIGAFPLSVYYFHQFPGLFFVTNLIVIPFLSIIMALGVFVMLLAVINCVPVFLAKALELFVFFLNTIIKWVASFEQFIFKDIPFNWQMLLSLYLMIFAVIIWFKKPNFNKLRIALVSIIVFQLSFFITRWSNQAEKEWIVFDVKKNTLITERNGESTIAYYGVIDKKLNENYNLKPYLTANFSELKKRENIKNLACFNNNKILIVDSLGVYSNKIKPDVLLITQSPKLNLERLIETINPKVIVADGSNFKSYIKIWKATCIKNKIPFHATGEKGFYRIEN